MRHILRLSNEATPCHLALHDLIDLKQYKLVTNQKLVMCQA